MKLKTKLCSTIVMFCLTIVTLMVGVWAVKSANVNIGGTLSFVAQGIEATISQGTMTNGTWQTASDATTKLKQIEITKDDTTSTLASKFSSWSGINLNFNENGDDITISFSITNNSDTNSIAVDVSTTYASATNCTIAIDTSSATIDPNASQNFTLTMKITDKDINASMTNFTVVFTMNLVKPATLQYDSTNDYYYVEMGTYNSAPVKWKLVGVDNSPLGSATATESGMGTFILATEECSAIMQPFNADNIGNDYATSDIRSYLKGQYLIDLNLANDATYQSISARSISDLYKDIGWVTDSSTIGAGYQYSPPAGATYLSMYDISTNETGSDKLWLMSVKELYTMVGGGTISSDGTIPYTWGNEIESKCFFGLGIEGYTFNSSSYFLRTPESDYEHGAIILYGGTGGWHNDFYSVSWECAVRPAFNVKFVYEVPPVNAEEVSYLTFTYNDTDMTAQLSACSADAPETIEIPEKVVYNEKTYKVTDILVEEVFDSAEDEYYYYSIFRNCTNTKSIIIPNSVTSIGGSAFYGCTGLTSITIPNSVTSIGESAFYGCRGLTTIIIPDSVTSIGSWAFHSCTGLTKVTIGTGVTTIGNSAFNGCTGLTSITIPDSVISIGNSAFFNCTGLTSISVDSGNSVYDSRNNCNALIETATNTLIQGCNNSTIPDGVTSIGSGAFYGCTGLTNVTIGTGVTTIGNSAFYNCTSLTSITIPDSVTSIGMYVFQGCTNLATVNVKATSVPTGGSNMFLNCSSSLVIYVPTASVSAYQSATYWSTYSSQIQGKDF